jgi:hypothetical protein
VPLFLKTGMCVWSNLIGGLEKSTKSSKSVSWTTCLQIFVTAYILETESTLVIVKVGKNNDKMRFLIQNGNWYITSELDKTDSRIPL